MQKLTVNMVNVLEMSVRNQVDFLYHVKIKECTKAVEVGNDHFIIEYNVIWGRRDPQHIELRYEGSSQEGHLYPCKTESGVWEHVEALEAGALANRLLSTLPE